MDQKFTPFFTKLQMYTELKISQFDVPGHKSGNIDDDFSRFVGHHTMMIDVNAPRGLDNLSHPSGVIKDAQDLMAEAFFADRAYFLTNGTSQGIVTMIMSTVGAKEKIILPRNVHKSIINGLILSGAIPVFIMPQMDTDLGIANGITVTDVKDTIAHHPDAKAILLINPTYFGVASDVKTIAKIAHDANMVVLVDEAHGSHFAFHDDLPLSGMQANADCVACSLHKTGGSLTQSSALLTKGEKVSHTKIRTILNVMSSTSPSALLMASLDSARKNLYFNANKELDKVIQMGIDARYRINKIDKVQAILPEYFTAGGEFSYDKTKIIIKVSDLGITGFDAYRELFDESKVQLELAETHLILALLSIGTKQKDIDALVDGLQKLSDKYRSNAAKITTVIADTYPESYTRPREAAAHAPTKYVKISHALNQIAAESIMIYPPGIPLVIPGEMLTKDVLDDLHFYQSQGSTILSDSDDGYIKVIDKVKWHKWEEDDDI